MIVPNRHGSTPAYRYGFNGKEKDDELKGIGNSYDFGARMYDPRVGRWFAPDKKEKKYAAFSTYNFSLNSPLMLMDPDGEDPLTGIIEALTAFGIDAGMQFANAMIFDNATIEGALESINWWSATWEGTKSYGIAAFAPPGATTIVRYKKLSNNKAFVFSSNVVANMIEQATTKFLNGEFKDKNGELTIKVLKEQFKTIFLTSLVEEFLGSKLGKKADELIEYVKQTDIKLANKLQKLKNKIESGESEERIEKYRNKVNTLNEKSGKALNERIMEKAKKAAAAKSASKEVENLVKEDDDTNSKK